MTDEEHIDLLEQYAEAMMALDYVSTSLDQYCKEKEDTETELEECKDELEECESCLEQSKKEIEELKSKLEESEKECEELEAKVDTLEIENKGLAERLANERMARIAAESTAGVSKNIVAMADAIKECMVKPEPVEKGKVSVRFTRDDGGVLRGATMVRELNV